MSVHAGAVRKRTKGITEKPHVALVRTAITLAEGARPRAGDMLVGAAYVTLDGLGEREMARLVASLATVAAAFARQVPVEKRDAILEELNDPRIAVARMLRSNGVA